MLQLYSLQANVCQMIESTHVEGGITVLRGRVVGVESFDSEFLLSNTLLIVIGLAAREVILSAASHLGGLNQRGNTIQI